MTKKTTGAAHSGLVAGSNLVGGNANAVETKLKQLKVKLSKVDFFHLHHGEEANKIHGWISPQGQYHHLDPKAEHKEWIKTKGFKGPDAHKEAHRAGWIEAGTGGLTEVSANSTILKQRGHPAVTKLREMVGKHWGNDFQMHLSDQPHSLHSVNAQHFSRYGVIKPPKTYKTIGEKLTILKAAISKANGLSQ